VKNSPKVEGFIIGFRGGLVWGAAAPLISLKYHFFIYAYLVMITMSLLGALYGARYMRRANESKQWLKLLFWSNTFTWIFPPAGFFTCTATRTINLRNQDVDRQLFMKLSTICFWLSFINIVVLAKYLA
jgi:hypothetical protein